MPRYPRHRLSTATFIVAASDSLHPERADYVCDGTSDQVEIQAAIDALPAVGGVVVLTEGNYNITAAIEVSDDCVGLIGSGHSTCINPSAACDYAIKINPTGDASNKLESNHIEAMRLALTGTVGGIDINYINEAYFRDLKITTGGRAINATQLWGGHFNQVDISDCTHGFYFNTPTSEWSADVYLANVFTAYCTYDLYAESSSVKHTKMVGALCEGSKILLLGASTIRISNSYLSCPIDASDTDSRISINNSYALGKIDLGKLCSVTRSIIREVVIHDSYCDVAGNIFEGTACDTEKLIDIQGHKNTVSNNMFVHNDAKYAVYCAGYGVSIKDNIFDNINSLNTWADSFDIYIDWNDNIIITGNWREGANSSFLGGGYSLSIIYDARSDMFMDVLAVSATHVANGWDVSAAGDISLEPVAGNQPDVPRTLSWNFAQHTNVTEFDLVIAGVDAKGEELYETFDETGGWSSETSNAFAVIEYLKYTRQAGAGDAGNIINVGITDVLGLSSMIYETSDIFKIKKNAANEAVAAAQVDVDYDTYDMSVIGLAATNDFTIWFKSNLNIIT